MGYNQDNIMVYEETSIAKKIFSSWKFNIRKPDIWFKKRDAAVEVHEDKHADYGTED